MSKEQSNNSSAAANSNIAAAEVESANNGSGSNSNASSASSAQDREGSSITVNVMGEMYSIKKRKLNDFNEALDFIKNNCAGVSADEARNLRKLFVIQNGSKQGKILEL